ncbi:MAG: hypothetical protein L0Y57_01015 [Beijerinckiaceae bacterium]|nr:hypothetical protein [Beijerinckiaceae bacterium]
MILRLEGGIPALVICAAALSVDAAAAQTAPPKIEGVLTILWADPRPGFKGGETRFNLTLPSGVTLPLALNPSQHTSAIGAFGKRVEVEGSVTSGPAGPERVAATKITLAESGEAPLQPKLPATKRVLYVLLKFKGDAQTPHSPNFYTALTNPLTGSAAWKIPATINGFYDKTSWSRLRWAGSVVGLGGLNPAQWLTLPRPKTAYANCGWSSACANIGLIVSDAMALVAAQGVSTASFDNINFVFNNDLDCCAYGGSFYYNGKVYGATWEPPWGQETGIYVHEFGHSIGLPHSGWVYYAYDSPWDNMSQGADARQILCGSYVSANSGKQTRNLYCTEPGAGYIAPHKDRLGWIPAANKVIVNSKSTRTVTLEANSVALATGIKMIKICIVNEACDGLAAHYLTVEARVKTAQFDLGLPGEGIVIHDFRANRGPLGGGNPCFFNTQSGWAVPIDATPGDWRSAPYCDSGGRIYPNYALHNAHFGAGKSYANAGTGIRVDVLSRTGTNFSVRVTRSK